MKSIKSLAQNRYSSADMATAIVVFGPHSDRALAVFHHNGYMEVRSDSPRCTVHHLC